MARRTTEDQRSNERSCRSLIETLNSLEGGEQSLPLGSQMCMQEQFSRSRKVAVECKAEPVEVAIRHTYRGRDRLGRQTEGEYEGMINDDTREELTCT